MISEVHVFEEGSYEYDASIRKTLILYHTFYIEDYNNCMTNAYFLHFVTITYVTDYLSVLCDLY